MWFTVYYLHEDSFDVLSDKSKALKSINGDDVVVDYGKMGLHNGRIIGRAGRFISIYRTL